MNQEPAPSSEDSGDQECNATADDTHSNVVGAAHEENECTANVDCGEQEGGTVAPVDGFEEKLKDPNSSACFASEELLIGPPELCRSDESRPGAFRAGGNMQSLDAPRTHDLLDNMDAVRETSDVLVDAELVTEPAIVYASAEPLHASAVDDSKEVTKVKEKSAKVWIRLVPILLLVGGVLAMFFLYNKEKKDVDDRAPMDKPGNFSEKSKRPWRLDSVHAVIWGYRTDCGNFAASPLEISCQGEGELELVKTDSADCAVQYESASCDLNNKTAVVLFRCASHKGNYPLEATAIFDASEASKCRSPQNVPDSNGRGLTSSRLYSGAAESFLALGRFCEVSGLLLFRNNYTCSSGVARYAFPTYKQRKLEEKAPKYCVSSEVCQVNSTCESDDDSCSPTCEITLDPLQITDEDDECFIEAGHDDGEVNETQLQKYLSIVSQHMLQ